MRFRLQLIGHFRFENTTADTEVSLKNGATLVGLIAVNHPQPVSRLAIMEALWPGTDQQVARNRLRVALSKLRALMGPTLIECSEGVGLSEENTSCDLWDFRALAEETKNAVDPGSEFAILEQLAAIVGDAKWLLCPEIASLDKAPLIKEEMLGYLLRAMELGLDHHRHYWVANEAKKRFSEFSKDGRLWALYLRAKTLLKEGELAMREVMSLSPQVLQSEDLQQTITWARLRSTQPHGNAPEIVGDQRQVALKVMELLIEKRADLMRPVLSAPETLSLSGANPRAMLSLLERVVDDPTEYDNHWQRCMARMIGLQAWVNDVEGVLKTADLLIPKATSPAILRAAWNSVGLAHSIARRWSEAMAAMDKTYEYALQTTDEVDALSVRGNRGYFLCHQGLYDRAEKEYAESFVKLEEINTTRAQFELVIGKGNRAFIPIYEGSFERAKELIEECYEMRSHGPHRVPMGLLLPCLAWIRLRESRSVETVPLLKQGLIECFGTESERFQQQALEFACAITAELRLGSLTYATLAFVEEWRTKTQLPRSEAEIQFCERVLAMVPTSQRHTLFDKNATPKSVGAEVMRSVRRAIQTLPSLESHT